MLFSIYRIDAEADLPAASRSHGSKMEHVSKEENFKDDAEDLK